MAEEQKEWRGLTPEELAKIDRWIQNMWSKRNCPLCSHVDWRPASYLVAPMTIANGGLQVVEGPGVYPMVAIMCGFCGFVAFANAYRMGLVKDA